MELGLVKLNIDSRLISIFKVFLEFSTNCCELIEVMFGFIHIDLLNGCDLSSHGSDVLSIDVFVESSIDLHTGESGRSE